MTEQFKPKGILKGHSGWVTQIATTQANPDMILSASRGIARDIAKSLVSHKAEINVIFFYVQISQLLYGNSQRTMQIMG